jgi:hypothetical protein
MSRSNDLALLIGMGLFGMGFATSAVAGSGSGLGPVAHWPFDEARGAVANDISGNGNHGTVFGNATWVRGVAGSAIHLDGIDDYINCGNSAVLNPEMELSISVWFRGTQSFSGSGNDPIVDKGYLFHEPPYYQYHLGISGNLYPSFPGSIGFTTSGGAGAGSGSGAWQIGVWRHVVATTSASETNLYVDGIQVAHTIGEHGPMQDYGRPFLIGKFANLNFYLPGEIDDLQVYGRALTCTEVQFLYAHPGEEVALGGSTVTDLDGDGAVGGSDLAIVLGSWGTCDGCSADLDCSGAVDAGDLAILLGAWTVGN